MIQNVEFMMIPTNHLYLNYYTFADPIARKNIDYEAINYTWYWINLICRYVDGVITRIRFLRRCIFDKRHDNRIAYCVRKRSTLGIIRSDSRLAPSQWETALLCNDVSHWLSASLEPALIIRIKVMHVSLCCVLLLCFVVAQFCHSAASYFNNHSKAYLSWKQRYHHSS